jgi:rRNA maturation endonuclease Nob1
MRKREAVKIWDASGIMNSLELPSGYTVPEVMSEIKDSNKVKLFDISVTEPSKESLNKIKVVASKLNEHKLSVADQKVLALALENNGIIMTNDNGIQNVAEFMGIPFEGNFFEIKRIINWKMYCTACEKYVHERVCDCGLPAVRRI